MIDAARRIAWIPDGNWSKVEERGGSEPLATPSLPGISILLDELD